MRSVFIAFSQEEAAIAYCSCVGQIHYIRGINFTIDYWSGVKHSIRDTILTHCGHSVSIVRDLQTHQCILQPPECMTAQAMPVDEHFAAIELLLRFVMLHMKSGYLHCAIADMHD